MRLFNFVIIAGNAGGQTDPELVATGTSGPTDAAAGEVPISTHVFASNFGDDTTDSPYGNLHLYDVSRTITAAEISVTQSLGAPMTGQVKSSFMVVMNVNNRG
jgi:hypothetical protein